MNVRSVIIRKKSMGVSLMTISLLRELVDLAYTLNFSETAERMHISTSALSKHLQAGSM